MVAAFGEPEGLAAAEKELAEQGLASEPNFSPWRIVANAKRKNPNQKGGGRPAEHAPADGAPRWRCPLVQQLTTDSTSPMGRIVSRWARQAEDFATGNVREAFAGLWARLQKAAASGESATNFVTAVLALAGSDTADHEATMQQAEELARADVACVARVGPDDFKSLQLAVRRICFQLTRDGGRVGAEAYPEEEEDEDAEPSRQGGCAGGALDFVDWRKERGLTGSLVLLISQADTVPKDTMGAVISCWAAACGDNDIPMVVLFGLQQPPQGRFDLLESDPLGNLRLESVGCLFDAQLVCHQLLEHIVSDPSCPLALAPELLQKLRNLFLYTRHSVSYVMKTLALLCEQALSENPLAAALCPPLDETVMPSNKAQLEKVFAARLRKAKGPVLTERLRELRAPEDRGCSENDLLNWAAEAAAQAILWRRGIIDSFGAWDVLLCATQPTMRYEVKMRRLCKLLQALWPSAGASGDADAEAKNRLMTGLLGSCLRLLDGEVTARDHLDRLVQDLLSAKTPLDAEFQAELDAMKGPDLKDGNVCNGLRGWFYKLRGISWQPLAGAPRELFLHGFSCSADHLQKVEKQLNGSGSFCSEALLLPLARGRGEGLPDDAALLFRLTETSLGRCVLVADLWECFLAHARPTPGGDAAGLKHRFGQALVMLHSMGLFVPRQGSRVQPEDGPPVSGWKLMKRRFGRLTNPLVEGQKPENTAGASRMWRELNPHVQENGAGDEVSASPVPDRSPAASPERRRKLQRLVTPTNLPLPSRLAKRPHEAPLQASQSAWKPESQPMVKTPGKRARIYMG